MGKRCCDEPLWDAFSAYKGLIIAEQLNPAAETVSLQQARAKKFLIRRT